MKENDREMKQGRKKREKHLWKIINQWQKIYKPKGGQDDKLENSNTRMS